MDGGRVSGARSNAAQKEMAKGPQRRESIAADKRQVKDARPKSKAVSVGQEGTGVPKDTPLRQGSQTAKTSGLAAKIHASALQTAGTSDVWIAKGGQRRSSLPMVKGTMEILNIIAKQGNRDDVKGALEPIKHPNVYSEDVVVVMDDEEVFSPSEPSQSENAKRKRVGASDGSTPDPVDRSRSQNAKMICREDKGPVVSEWERRCKELSAELDLLVQQTNDLQLKTVMYENTKLEIKESARDLKFKLQYFQDNWKDAMNGEIRSRADRIDVASQVNLGPQMSDYSKESLRARIKTALACDTGFEGVKDILNVKWPSEAYKMTSACAENGDLLAKKGDVAVIVDPRSGEEPEFVKLIGERFNGLWEQILGNDGQVDYRCQTLRTRNSQDEITGVCYIVPMDLKNKEKCMEEELYAKLKMMAELTKLHPKAEVTVVAEEGVHRVKVRKILEYADVGAETQYKVVLRGSKKDVRKPEPRANALERATRKPEGVVTVSGEGRSYADLVREVKEKVDVKGIGVTVTRIRRTDRGDLQLAVEGGGGKAEALQQAIRVGVQGSRVSSRATGTTTVFILGLDPTISEEEVRDAIGSACEIGKADIQVRALRDAKYGEKTAIVDLPKDKANQIIRARRLTIGWSSCSVKERIEMVRCFRCLDYGHRMQECKAETNRINDCLNCLQSGHRLKDCKNQASCYKCGQPGHRMDSMRCPVYKAQIEKRREERIATAGPKVAVQPTTDPAASTGSASTFVNRP